MECGRKHCNRAATGQLSGMEFLALLRFMKVNPKGQLEV